MPQRPVPVPLRLERPALLVGRQLPRRRRMHRPQPGRRSHRPGRRPRSPPNRHTRVIGAPRSPPERLTRWRGGMEWAVRTGPLGFAPAPWDRPARRSGEDGALCRWVARWVGPGGHRAPCSRLARWVGSSGPCSHLARSSTPAAGLVGQRGLAALPAGSGCGGMSSVGGVFSVGWGGGQPAVGVAGQPPPSLMHRAVVGSADQGQVVQVGGAAMQPMLEMVGFAPGQGSRAAGEDTAAVADDQGGALGGGDDSGGAADLQGLGGAAPKGWGEAPGRRLEQGGQAALVTQAVRWSGRSRLVPWPSWPGSWWSWWCWSVRWRVTRTRVTAPSQASRRQASGSSAKASPTSPPRVPGWPRRLSRSTVTSSWGRTPPDWGSWPCSRLRRASSVRASARR